MGATETALAGIAQILHDTGAGVFRPDGAYLADERAIVIGRMPAQPDNVILLNPYPLTDDPTLGNSDLGLQCRYRGTAQDARSVMSASDDVFEQLQGLGDITFAPGLRLLIAERRSGTSLGEDKNGRPEWSDNYLLRLYRASAHRI